MARIHAPILIAAPVLVASALSAAPAHADRYFLDYSATAFLLPLGHAHIDVVVAPDRYDVVGQVQSEGLVSLFEKTNLTAAASGVMGSSGPQWREYGLNHFYSKKHRTIAMQTDGVSLNVNIKPTYRLWGDPPASAAQKRISRDPLSTLVAMGVSVGRSQGCGGAFPVFDGRFRYDLTLSDAGRESSYDSGGYEGPVIRCAMHYTPIAGYDSKDGSAQKQKKIPAGEVWFAVPQADSFAPPVQALMPLPVGRAKIRLARWVKASVSVADETKGEPSSDTPAPSN